MRFTILQATTYTDCEYLWHIGRPSKKLKGLFESLDLLMNLHN